MKLKYLSLFVFLCLVIIASSCGNNSVQQENEISTKSYSHTSLKDDLANTATNILLQTEAQTTNQELTNPDEVGGAVIGLDKYRVRYYDIPYPFVYLVGEEKYREWRENQANPNDSNVMMMVNFIQDFNISREDFDKANSESAWRIKYLLDGVPMMNPQDYANQEPDEVYNADIIYTFDNELINEYYLSHDYPYWYADEYEDAVASGIYKTRTSDFVEVPEEQPMPESSN